MLHHTVNVERIHHHLALVCPRTEKNHGEATEKRYQNTEELITYIFPFTQTPHSAKGLDRPTEHGRISPNANEALLRLPLRRSH